MKAEINLFIISTEVSAQNGKKPVNAVIDNTGAVFLHNCNAEQTLRWACARFQPLPAEAHLDRAINCVKPGDLLFLKDFQSTDPLPGTFFGLTLDTAPSDIVKAVLEQTAFYFYFLATKNFDLSSYTAVSTAGSIFRYDSLCRILANLFNLAVERLGNEAGGIIEDEAALHPNGPISLKSIQLNSSAERTDTIFKPVKSTHTLFRNAYYRYLKVFDDVSVYIHALKK